MDTLLLAPVLIPTPEVPPADLLYNEGRFGRNLPIFPLG